MTTTIERTVVQPPDDEFFAYCTRTGLSPRHAMVEWLLYASRLVEDWKDDDTTALQHAMHGIASRLAKDSADALRRSNTQEDS